jgi:hypothetical protein
LCNDNYPKATLVLISSKADFQNWIKTIIEAQAKQGGIVLTMENPQVKEQLARKEALLAKSVCTESSQIASLSRPRASDEVHCFVLFFWSSSASFVDVVIFYIHPGEFKLQGLQGSQNLQ